MILVAVAGCRGDPREAFRARKLVAEEPPAGYAAAMKADGAQMLITSGHCSCDLYRGDAEQSFDEAAERRRYLKKGWSSAKIDRAVESKRTHRPRTSQWELADAFAAAVCELARQGARVTLLASNTDAEFAAGAAQSIPVLEFAGTAGCFPRDTLVRIER